MSSGPSTVYGQSVSSTASVRAADAADGTPSGNVEFVDTATGAVLGIIPISAGSATLTTTMLAAGSHTITAEYEGSNPFAFSVSSITQTVQKDGTATGVSSSANPSNLVKP